MDAWIDTYHAVRQLAQLGRYVFLTDGAVGSKEEDNLRHLVTNLGIDVPREGIIPFLTAKHTVEYCLRYADRAIAHGFPDLVVLGGDRTIGPPRCVEHAWQLREAIRQRQPALRLGGWANPSAPAPKQVEYLLDREAHADFFLTQIVSHHRANDVEHFMREARRMNLTLEGLFGVFFYRSANPRTLEALSQFLPVPAQELTSEFASGASAIDVCARTIRTMLDLGVRHIYVSNLPLQRTRATLDAILEQAGLNAHASR